MTTLERASNAATRAARGAGWNGGAFLSAPSKMPGFSWSLPAGRSCPGSKVAGKLHGDASTCAGCYAKEGNYQYPSVQSAQDGRFTFVRESIRENGGAAFVAAMVAAVRLAVELTGDPFFRVHDSGDLFSAEYARAWAQIARALPHVRIWIPTREYVRPCMLPALEELAAEPNVTLRPSALRVSDPPPVVPGLGPGTMVAMQASDVPPSAHICPATFGTDKTCDGNRCRACWGPQPVAYLAHGAAMARRRRTLPVVAA